MLDSLNNKYVLALGRVLLVLVYFKGGFALFTGGVPVEYAASKGVPAFAVWIGFAIKFFGGLCVIIGFQTRLAALALIAFTLGTAFIFHTPGTEAGGSAFWKEISMIGGLLILAATGAGALSVDGRNRQ